MSPFPSSFIRNVSCCFFRKSLRDGQSKSCASCPVLRCHASVEAPLQCAVSDASHWERNKSFSRSRSCKAADTAPVSCCNPLSSSSCSSILTHNGEIPNQGKQVNVRTMTTSLSSGHGGRGDVDSAFSSLLKCTTEGSDLSLLLSSENKSKRSVCLVLSVLHSS